MANSEIPYSVKKEGKLIVVERFGQQSAESVTSIRKEIEKIMAESGGSPMDVLVIVRPTSRPDELSRQESVRSLKEINYKRVAIVVTTRERMPGARFVQVASDAGDRVRLFRSEEDARTWLRES